MKAVSVLKKRNDTLNEHMTSLTSKTQQHGIITCLGRLWVAVLIYLNRVYALKWSWLQFYELGVIIVILIHGLRVHFRGKKDPVYGPRKPVHDGLRPLWFLESN